MPALNHVTKLRLKPVLAILLTLCAISPARAADSPAPDWSKLNAEALGYFQSYLRFDTSNPPDNTADAIAFLKQILDKAGIETQVFAGKPGKANLIARLPGPAGLKPMLL